MMLSFLIVSISSLISVAFYTIAERKVLGYIQIRKGPNKVGIMGILQPFSDAIKLFSKSIIISEQTNPILTYTSPALAFVLSLMIIPIIPFSYIGLMDSNFSILSFFIISSLSVYALLLIGWSANSKYCYLGSIRGMAQMISYEVSLFMIVLSSVILSNSFSFFSFSSIQISLPFIIILSFIFGVWMITCLAETNRSPFDFAEGESELVSGFNVEFMGGWFAMIFLAEYLSMIILSFISSVIFMGTMMTLFSWTFIILVSLMFLWVRGTFPRFRYDLLMILSWKIFLPISITFFSLYFSFFLFGL